MTATFEGESFFLIGFWFLRNFNAWQCVEHLHARQGIVKNKKFKTTNADRILVLTKI